jgi:hypothetical protein
VRHCFADEAGSGGIHSLPPLAQRRYPCG